MKTLVQQLTATLIALLTILALTAAPAAAHVVRPPVLEFTPSGLERVGNVAVDQTSGDVYVAGESSGNVEEFNAAGVEQTGFVSPALAFPYMAVDSTCYQRKLTAHECESDPSNGDVYVAEAGAQRVVKFDILRRGSHHGVHPDRRELDPRRL